MKCSDEAMAVMVEVGDLDAKCGVEARNLSEVLEGNTLGKWDRSSWMT